MDQITGGPVSKKLSLWFGANKRFDLPVSSIALRSAICNSFTCGGLFMVGIVIYKIRTTIVAMISVICMSFPVIMAVATVFNIFLSTVGVYIGHLIAFSSVSMDIRLCIAPALPIYGHVLFIAHCTLAILMVVVLIYHFSWNVVLIKNDLNRNILYCFGNFFKCGILLNLNSFSEQCGCQKPFAITH